LCFFKKNKNSGRVFVFGNLVGPIPGPGKGGKRGVGKEGKEVPIMCKVTPWCEGIIGREASCEVIVRV
jgi:hypothetical protein